LRYRIQDRAWRKYSQAAACRDGLRIARPPFAAFGFEPDRALPLPNP
jgi:hypothetical protein